MADINGRSFLATLTGTTAGVVYPIRYLWEQAIAGSGWLTQGGDPRYTAQLRFDFVEDRGDRLHYAISGGPDTDYPGAQLGVSRNGYLGFYSVANASDIWKIELEGDSTLPDTFDFILRDARGYRVGSVYEPSGVYFGNFAPSHPARTSRFLNVEEGEIVHFRGRIVEYL